MSRPVSIRQDSRQASSPSSAKGRTRVKAILEGAKTVLTENGYTQFSLRNVANAAGVHLSHLQYYFPSRDALIIALVEYVEQGYWSIYEERTKLLPSTPYPRFLAILDFLIEDDQDTKTRRFFVQLWALLETTDDSGDLLARLYTANIETLATYIAEINPTLSHGARHQRATMIHAMIDGMMLMLKEADRYLEDDQEKIQLAMRKQLVRIATDS